MNQYGHHQPPVGYPPQTPPYPGEVYPPPPQWQSYPQGYSQGPFVAPPPVGPPMKNGFGYPHQPPPPPPPHQPPPPPPPRHKCGFCKGW
ncbi:hypothetical protein L484_018472 [Morus notabilis]|uniref:Uncharacterized protein n=1 Tax=Morus notabilis TaxID=981085 RepID=W9S3L0_9ROSA|nr:hypothetical protein L484_018472 [Morus notabilis]